MNLAFKSKILTDFDLVDFFYQSKAKYKILYPDEFVCFSPESFVSIQNGLISSYPMKGTIDADIPNARAKLLEDPKERAEHITIVDLIRNDLAMVAVSFRHRGFRN